MYKTNITFVEAPDGETVVELDYPLGDEARLWDEFRPALYRLTLDLDGGEVAIGTTRVPSVITM